MAAVWSYRHARAATLAAFVLGLAIVSWARPAGAAITFKRCAPGSTLQCGRLSVPLDRSGAAPGRVSLRIVRRPAAHPSGRAVFAFAGGPGQGAGDFAEDFAFNLGSALNRRDLVVVDQRGTGASGALDCRAVDRVSDLRRAGGAVRGCAAKLGRARAFYLTRDTVQDIEAVRSALGYGRISLFGVSYGTKVELAYAAAHPEHVERMVLDSVVTPDGPDPLLRESFAAVPRVLRELCSAAACKGVTSDPAGDLAALVRRIGGSALHGHVYTPAGRRRARSITAADVYSLLFAGDFAPILRAQFPSVVRSADRGDPAPLLRLFELLRPPAHPEPAELREFSTGLWLATVCGELRFPWDPSAREGSRRTGALAAVAALGPLAFSPFNAQTALDSPIVHMCEHWPETPGPTAQGDLSRVTAPTLLIDGRADLRTPLENARETAARLRSAQVVAVSRFGHSVVGGGPTQCPVKAMIDFLAGRKPASRCSGPGRLPIRALAPMSLRGVTPAGEVAGTSRARTFHAVELTLQDVASELDLTAENGGLRGGGFRVTLRGLEVRSLAYVPGVRVSGILDPGTWRGTLTVSGSAAARGRLRIGRRLAVSGTLAGRRVSGRYRLPVATGLGDGGGRAQPSVPVWTSFGAPGLE